MEINTIIEKYKQEVVKIRRLLHQYPEIACQEYCTSQYIEEYLRNLGLSVETGVGGNGIVGILEGRYHGPNIGIRADMDALPINENNQLLFKSQREGIMHACGHDGHMAMVLVTASILKELQEKIEGKVTFIFQPAEENLPEGGAKKMIKDKAELFNSLNAILGIHIWPYLESGKIVLSDKIMMAAGDIFYIKLLGTGGHGAVPHEATDLVSLTGILVSSLNSLTKRISDVFNPVVISIGQIEGGKGTNIIPSEIILKGTVRYIKPNLEKTIHGEIEKILQGLTQAFDANYEFQYYYGYPALKSDSEIVEIVKSIANEVVGEEKVLPLDKPSMASEDFPIFLENTPGCYFWLGSYNPKKNIVFPLHHPQFDIDEEVLLTGTKILVRSILALLRNGGDKYSFCKSQ